MKKWLEGIADKFKAQLQFLHRILLYRPNDGRWSLCRRYLYVNGGWYIA